MAENGSGGIEGDAIVPVDGDGYIIGSGEPVVDPAELGTGNSGGTGDAPRKRRGRPAGTGTRKSKASAPNLSGIESLLVSLHVFAAAALKEPALALTKDEAKSLSDAVGKVAEHYPVTIDPKTMAWVNLAMVAGGIYGTRVVGMVAKRKRNTKGSEKTQTVTPQQPQDLTAYILGQAAL